MNITSVLYTRADLLDTLETLDADMGLETLPLDTLQSFVTRLDIKLTSGTMDNKKHLARVLRARVYFPSGWEHV